MKTPDERPYQRVRQIEHRERLDRRDRVRERRGAEEGVRREARVEHPATALGHQPDGEELAELPLG